MSDLYQIIPNLKNLYKNDKPVLEKQINRYQNLDDWFSQKFPEKNRHYLSVPGRVEIGGNHTDHNQGRVLAASVDLDSIAVAAPTENNKVTLFSEGYENSFKCDLDDLYKKNDELGTTAALIRGVAAGLKKNGWKVGGFNACITSEVLPGSGLSSSASIEVLIGAIFSALYNKNAVKAEELAKIGQFAENEFFGKPCGLMDQMACAVGGIIAIDFKDVQSPQTQKINFNFEKQNYRLLVVDSGGNHADLTSDYAAIPTEMKSVARAMGKNVCREIPKDNFLQTIKDLRKKSGDRAVLRAFHFIQENERVLKQVSLLENDRFKDFLTLVRDSGNSSFKWLQNVYTNTNISEQGVSLALALSESFISGINEGACRVHGGGFAGTILVFLPQQSVNSYIELMESVFSTGCVKVLKIREFGALYMNSL